MVFASVLRFSTTSTWGCDVKSRLAIADGVGDVDCRNGYMLDAKVILVMMIGGRSGRLKSMVLEEFGIDAANEGG
jgi:hypothetical protein